MRARRFSAHQGRDLPVVGRRVVRLEADRNRTIDGEDSTGVAKLSIIAPAVPVRLDHRSARGMTDSALLFSSMKAPS